MMKLCDSPNYEALLRIRIQHFKWILFRIQSFDEQKLDKIYSWKIFNYFFFSKIAWTSKLQEKPSALKEDIRHFKKLNLLIFFLF